MLGGFLLARLAIGSKRSLDILSDIMEHTIGQDVFAYAAFNVNEVLAKRQHMRCTYALLQE